LFTVRGEARLADRRQHSLDLPSRDLRGRSIAERGHDVPEGEPTAALVRGARLGEHRAMTGQCGRLRAAHVLQPSQVGVGDLAKGHAPRAALALHALDVCGLGDVLGHKLCGGNMSCAFVVGAIGDASAMPAPSIAVRVALEPRGADAALDLATVVTELGLVERLAVVLADDDAGRWIRCWHRGISGVPSPDNNRSRGDFSLVLSVSLARGYHVGTIQTVGTTLGTKPAQTYVSKPRLRPSNCPKQRGSGHL
jgi:hypothetical protein